MKLKYRKYVMKRFLYSCLCLIMAFAMGACQTTEQADQDLLANSPFRSQSQQDLSNILIITCTYHAFEISAHIDAAAWLQDPCQSTAATDSTDTTAPPEAPPAPTIRFSNRSFDPQQTNNWYSNGLCITAMPNEDWPQLRERIIASNAITLPTRQSMIRRADDVMELPLGPVAQTNSVFISDNSGRLRGYSLPEGVGLLRLSAIVDKLTPQRQVYFEIVPLVQSTRVEEEFGTDEQGTLRLLTRNPEIIFDQLLLSGILEDNWSICIVAKSTDNRIDSLGQILMANHNNADNRQVIILITLKTQTAEEMRNSVQ